MTDRSSEQTGPWALALGVALIGAAAVSVEGYRAVRRRFQGTDSSADE